MVSFSQYEGPRGQALRASSRTTRTSLDPGHLSKAITTTSWLHVATLWSSHGEAPCGRTTTSPPLRLDQIPDHRAKQRVDQCMHDLKDERGYFIQKSTGLGANIKFNKTALRCSGHRGQGHSHLQGVAPNGLLRTAMAAVHPKTMCQCMKLDYLNYLNKMNLLHIKPWPTDMSWFT